ncbi:MAG TPA: site-specific DNA-methyltransferase [Methanofastidiosum sp.]|nr:site-specific DNA-methyltransferase [Methanofastidiosum sp.]
MVNLYLGDALDLLDTTPDESVDLVVTDPPYNSSAIEWDGKDDEWQFKWLEKVKIKMKEGASFYMFFAPMNMYGVERWIRQNLTLKNLIVWHHSNLYSAGLSYGKDRYKSTWDVIFYATKGNKAKHGKNVSQTAYLETGRGFDVIITPQPRPLLHRAQKPFGVIERFIRCSSNEGDVVFDPFMGVGTTGIVARFLGRHFIGFEKNKLYFNISKARISCIETNKDYRILSTFDKQLWLLLKQKKENKINDKELEIKLRELGVHFTKSVLPPDLFTKQQEN